MAQSFITAWLLPLALAFIMFGIGLSLTLANFKRLGKRPAMVFIGLLGQLLLMPALAFLLAWILQLPEPIAIGMLLLAACPGGTMSNVMSQLLRADLALSVSLTALSTIGCILTTPVILHLAIEGFGHTTAPVVNVAHITLGILIIALVPVGLGMLFNAFLPKPAQKLEPNFQRFSLLFLCVLVVGMVVKEWDLLMQTGILLLCSALLLSFATSALGWLSGAACRADSPVTRTLCIEIGVQNAALAMVIALSFLHTPAYSVFAGLYGIVMYLAPWLLISLLCPPSRKVSGVNAPS